MSNPEVPARVQGKHTVTAPGTKVDKAGRGEDAQVVKILAVGESNVPQESGSDRLKKENRSLKRSTQGTLTDPSIVAYDHFLIKQIAVQRNEQTQIIQTFDENILYSFGEAPVRAQFQGVLINSKQHNWRNGWLHVYDRKFRATKSILENITTFISFEDVQLKGKFLNTRWNMQSSNTMRVGFQFTYYVEDVIHRSTTEFTNDYSQMLNNLEADVEPPTNRLASPAVPDQDQTGTEEGSKGEKSKSGQEDISKCAQSILNKLEKIFPPTSSNITTNNPPSTTVTSKYPDIAGHQKLLDFVESKKECNQDSTEPVREWVLEPLSQFETEVSNLYQDSEPLLDNEILVEGLREDTGSGLFYQNDRPLNFSDAAQQAFMENETSSNARQEIQGNVRSGIDVPVKTELKVDGQTVDQIKSATWDRENPKVFAASQLIKPTKVDQIISPAKALLGPLKREDKEDLEFPARVKLGIGDSALLGADSTSRPFEMRFQDAKYSLPMKPGSEDNIVVDDPLLNEKDISYFEFQNNLVGVPLSERKEGMQKVVHLYGIIEPLLRLSGFMIRLKNKEITEAEFEDFLDGNGSIEIDPVALSQSYDSYDGFLRSARSFIESTVSLAAITSSFAAKFTLITGDTSEYSPWVYEGTTGQKSPLYDVQRVFSVLNELKSGTSSIGFSLVDDSDQVFVGPEGDRGTATKVFQGLNQEDLKDPSSNKPEMFLKKRLAGPNGINSIDPEPQAGGYDTLQKTFDASKLQAKLLENDDRKLAATTNFDELFKKRWGAKTKDQINENAPTTNVPSLGSFILWAYFQDTQKMVSFYEALGINKNTKGGGSTVVDSTKEEKAVLTSSKFIEDFQLKGISEEIPVSTQVSQIETGLPSNEGDSGEAPAEVLLNRIIEGNVPKGGNPDLAIENYVKNDQITNPAYKNLAMSKVELVTIVEKNTDASSTVLKTIMTIPAVSTVSNVDLVETAYRGLGFYILSLRRQQLIKHNPPLDQFFKMEFGRAFNVPGKTNGVNDSG